MKFFIAVSLFLFFFTIQSALAAETAPAQDGMKIAEELLLREDQSEELPAKERVEKKQENQDEALPAPVLAEEPADGADEEIEISSPQMLAEKPEPGSLKFEMATVDLLTDAQPPEEDSHEEIAKR